MSRLLFLTYAAGRYERNVGPNSRFVQQLGGADEVHVFGRADVENSAIYAGNRDVLDAPRGAGYWAWKPWVILQVLDRAGPGDVVYYHDCGFGWRYKAMLRPRTLMAMTREQGFLAGVRCSQYGPNRLWNRRQCLTMMGCADNPAVLEADTVQATFSMWTNTPESRRFLEEWLAWCLTYDAVRDATVEERALEASDFIEHRHDQAILTNMAVMEGAPSIGVRDMTQDYSKSMTAVELDLRGQDSVVADMLYRGVRGAMKLRRRVTG